MSTQSCLHNGFNYIGTNHWKIKNELWYYSVSQKCKIIIGQLKITHSTADTCKNCAKCGEGFKIGTNEAYNIKIKIRLGGISKFSAFVLTPIWLPQTKAFHWRRNSWKNFYLTSRINVTIGKSSQNSSKTTLEQYWLDESWLRYLTWKIRQNCWQGRISIFLTSFCEIQYAITQRGSPRSNCFMGHFESVFKALFSCGIYIVNKQDNKNMFLNNFDFMVKSLYAQ